MARNVKEVNISTYIQRFVFSRVQSGLRLNVQMHDKVEFFSDYIIVIKGKESAV